jgi:purine-cytosine permease-like protein
MVTLRGLVGRRGSVLPTILNIAQNIGWATMDDHRHLHRSGGSGRRRLALAVCDLGRRGRHHHGDPAGSGSVRLLRKVMVWLVLAGLGHSCCVQVLLQPRQSIPQNSILGFWPAVDLCHCRSDLLCPLAADYSRHSRTARAAFWGASLGYGLAAIAYYALGVFAVVNLGASDVITALVTLRLVPSRSRSCWSTR